MLEPADPVTSTIPADEFQAFQVVLRAGSGRWAAYDRFRQRIQPLVLFRGAIELRGYLDVDPRARELTMSGDR